MSEAIDVGKEMSNKDIVQVQVIICVQSYECVQNPLVITLTSSLILAELGPLQLGSGSPSASAFPT